MKRIFPFTLFAILVVPFHADKFSVAQTRSNTEWHVEKTPSNPIFRQDDEHLFPNSDFEMGDWTGWKVVSGTAWINTPSGCAGAPNDNFFFGIPDLAGGYRTACSDHGGDAAVGVLKSQTFTVHRKYISFISAGWDGIDGTSRQNRIELIRASDDSVLLTAFAPLRDTWGINWWDVSPYRGLSVYIRVTDANSNGTHGWIGVGHFYAADSNWEDFSVRTPGLLHDANGIAIRRDGRYWMFYSGETFSNAKRNVLQRMGLAFSSDLLHWSKLGIPIIPLGEPGAFDEFGTSDPDVISVNGTLWMFYVGNGSSSYVEPEGGKVGLAWCKEDTDCSSPANWTKYKNPATRNALLSPPPGQNYWGMSVLHEDGSWKLWVDQSYKGNREQTHYYYADSPNPGTTNWKSDVKNPVWSIREACGVRDPALENSHEIGQPSVFKYGTKYYMAYHKFCDLEHIYTALASSPDGVHWTDSGLLLTGDIGKWDAAQVHFPFATVIDGDCFILYGGAKILTGDMNSWSIGSARIVNFAAHESRKQ